MGDRTRGMIRRWRRQASPKTVGFGFQANMGAGIYDTFEATGELADPEWPELNFWNC